jgi:hypothetical protein
VLGGIVAITKLLVTIHCRLLQEGELLQEQDENRLAKPWRNSRDA